MQGNVSEGISKLVSYKRPAFIIPSPDFYWDTDFLVYEDAISDAIKDSNIYLMDNKTKYLNDERNAKKYRLVGSTFWNDYEGLNTEMVTLSLIKSPHFQRISADTWLESPHNLQSFFEINEELKKNNVYYKIYKQYYKVGKFHPIISYLLYQDNLRCLKNELNRPFDGETILLTHNQPSKFGIYFDGNQIESSSSKLNLSLKKSNDIEDFVSKKTSLESILNSGSVDYLIHGNSDRDLSYQFNKTRINAIDNTNVILELADSSSHVKNTLNFLLEENQRFVDIIRKSMINSNEIIENTDDFINFVKLYTFVFSLLDNEFFGKLLSDLNKEIVFINLGHFNITTEETSSNAIVNVSGKINYMLNVISKNHFTLQSLVNSF